MGAEGVGDGLARERGDHDVYQPARLSAGRDVPHPRARPPLPPCAAPRVGGAAQVFFRPEDPDDLAHFLRDRPRDVPASILGVGSNSLIRDGGVPGVVIRLSAKAFGSISIEPEEGPPYSVRIAPC